MHFYWRMIEELKLLGETWIIHDPSLLRCYREWLRRNQSAIENHLQAAGPIDGGSTFFQYHGMTHSLN